MTKLAILHKFDVGVVLLVLHVVIIALLALRTSQCDLVSHDKTPYLKVTKKHRHSGGAIIC